MDGTVPNTVAMPGAADRSQRGGARCRPAKPEAARPESAGRPRSPRGTAAAMAVLVAVTIAGCAGPTLPRPSLPCTSGPVDNRLAERNAFALINRQREDQSLPALRWDDTLAEIARRYSQTLADADRGLTHKNFKRRRDAAARRLGVVRVAENLALSCGSARSAPRLAVDGWLASPPHREAILDSFVISGIGVAQGRSGYLYFTQLFASRR